MPLKSTTKVFASCNPKVLCRFRLVCKKWNHLISQPSFATLRALSPRRASSIFISPKLKFINKTSTDTEWQVLDPTEERSYKLSDAFIMDSYLPSSSNRGLRNPYIKYTLAADGELIYTMYDASDLPPGQRMHIVCNPVSKSFHEIPEIPICYSRDNVFMSMDNATKTYKIVIMEKCRDTTKPGSRNLFLYESVTSTWRKVCEVPDFMCSSSYSSIFMKGIFYTLFVDLSGTPTWPMFHTVVLYSCDLVTGAWCKLDVGFPPLSTSEDYPQLVISSGRLYMVKFTRFSIRMELSIWKIVLETKEVVQVAKIQKCVKFDQKLFHMTDMQVAVGCADSIFISSEDGLRVKFDLLEKHWHELPRGNGVMTDICACVDF